MAVGNVAVPDIIYPIEGIKLSATAAGVRYKDRDDLVVIEIADTATTAVVTTKNTFCAAPVRVRLAWIVMQYCHSRPVSLASH